MKSNIYTAILVWPSCHLTGPTCYTATGPESILALHISCSVIHSGIRCLDSWPKESQVFRNAERLSFGQMCFILLPVLLSYRSSTLHEASEKPVVALQLWLRFPLLVFLVRNLPKMGRPPVSEGFDCLHYFCSLHHRVAVAPTRAPVRLSNARRKPGTRCRCTL
ncbi:hypothetical protein K469DRAFT_162126 [Zopfia rhizophila CBS 207.26]|uniref:Uncharacterized protein n=1 Tax=Zopfia rhizophila CBS 207.26 TaxID=1314779 RepID=A0A6A6E0X4_9PEZI|nr:hypothetical protein K469DRAFT_162126 [Zopfia rhizophila CBS 207.26]